ncbi:hypothetical protein LV84_02291 [Algoriphagus ratkowskyi]|uniref:Phosphate-selective porin O/P n=1 Tax=Algoriphagus ratkowskyi TaxID=57028 RepID=A0A2W7RN51_9BACT|nr:hypothetical protein [Algoriphagus ratkowskyi]PZX55929.1 hypothetical protein LV84_02291 [Algoriphagus ratkowskyi]TXD77256.1 hypothetical protein ESW18_13255 [Algoriphagus ratkowskyi]
MAQGQFKRDYSLLFAKRFFFLIVMALLQVYPSVAQEKPELKIGGALRFNYNLSSWKDGQKKRGGDFGYDLFRINTKASYKGIFLDAEYRLYSSEFGGGMLKQGWIGYNFNDQNQIQVGLTQVPFGIQQYNSNNWFFNLPYYVGLEDDLDMGVKYVHTGEKIEYHLAFFKNAEELKFGDNTEISPSRYSYDIAGRNKEANQINGKFVYKFGKEYLSRVGISLQYGGLYNLDTEEMGNHSALSIHYELTKGLWDVKVQFISAAHNPENAAGESREIVSMAAYGAPYQVASDFTIYTLNVARNVPVEWGPVSSLKFYNDFAFMGKNVSGFTDSFMNVTGVLVAAGNVYTYIDYAAGYNHSWLGGNFVDDFAKGNPNATWEARFNVNLGYYF